MIADQTELIQTAAYAVSPRRSGMFRLRRLDVCVANPKLSLFILKIVQGRHPVLDVTLAENSFPTTIFRPNKTTMMIITARTWPQVPIRQAAIATPMVRLISLQRSCRRSDRPHLHTSRSFSTNWLAASPPSCRNDQPPISSTTPPPIRLSFSMKSDAGRAPTTACRWPGQSRTPARDITSRTLFATHYHELTELEELLDGVKNFNVLVREWHDQVVFLHKITPGGTDKSYGIHVARLAGMPKDVINRARALLAELERNFVRKSISPELRGSGPPHTDLFDQPQQAILFTRDCRPM